MSDPGGAAHRGAPAAAAVSETPFVGGGRLTEALIDLGAVAANTRLLSAHTDAGVMAVVKAEGFGHGAVPVARTALASGASWLGVSFTAEALALRAAGIRAPILTWMQLPDEDFSQALRADIDLSVSSLAHLDGIAACAQRLRGTAEIHLKADTGLHRNGSGPAEWPALVEAAAQLEREGLVHVRGIWSHLVHPDDPNHPTTDRQVEAFDTAVRQAEAVGLRGRMRHLANSGAALAAPHTHYDLVRAGIGLYGVEPVRGRRFGLTPAMTLSGRVIMVRRVAAGEGISYGHCYTTREETGLALVPLGYADGLPRAASGRAQIWIDGERRPVAGRIAMDQCVVDVGQAEVEMGQQAVIFGTGASGEPTVEEWAAWAGTNAHEVLTGIGTRVARRYVSAPVAQAYLEESISVVNQQTDAVAASSDARTAAAAGAEVPGGGARAHDQDSTILAPAADADRRPRRERLRVLVLFGGPGGEYEVSCASAASIVTHLDRDRYTVQPVRISPDGDWIEGPADFAGGVVGPHDLVAATPAAGTGLRGGRAQNLAVLAAADVVIPALHGPFGEDGTLQALMDAVGARYVGSGMAASALGMDKDAAKRVLLTNGLPVADWAVLRSEGEELADGERERLGLPVFVKPARSGSSVGVSRVQNWDELSTAIAGARKWDERVLVEAAVVGREVDVAVLEHPDGRLEAGPPLEIRFAGGRDFFDYDAKYADQATSFTIPAELDPAITAELRRLALRAFEILGCRGLARVDFLLRGGVEPVFNEINTFPGFTVHSQYPSIWAAAGLPFGRLLDLLIESALAKHAAA
jgi:alanine racemase